MPIRIKLVIMSLLFLAIPSLLIGIIGYQSSANSLNTLGAEGLQTDVRMTIAMIGALKKQVEGGKFLWQMPRKKSKQQYWGKKIRMENVPSILA